LSTYRSTRVTPTLSVALTETATLPVTCEPVAGDVITAAGGSESDPLFWTVTLTAADVPVFPAASYALASSVWLPLETVFVSQEKEYGLAVSVVRSRPST